MPVLNLAAHWLGYLQETEGHDDDNGDFVPGSKAWVDYYCKCDVVPAGKANTIPIADGQVETYSYTIYNLPTNCREFKYGDTVRIKMFGTIKEFKVLGFHRYQLQCKMWV